MLRRFGYITNPRTPSDDTGRYRKLRRLPPSVSDAVVKLLPPYPLDRTLELNAKTGAGATGSLYEFPLTDRQILSYPPDIVIKKLIQAGKIAQRQGVDILGLGLLASSVADWGQSVADALDIPVCTGLSYDIVSGVEAIHLAAFGKGMDPPRCHLVVIGAETVVGALLARLLAKEVGFLTLTGTEAGKLDRLATQILHEEGIAAKVVADPRNALSTADIVIIAKRQAKAIDAASYGNVSLIYMPRHIAGGVRDIPNLLPNQWLVQEAIIKPPSLAGFEGNPGDGKEANGTGLTDNLLTPSLTEPMVIAMEGKFRNYGVGGKVTIDDVWRLKRSSTAQGFKVMGFLSGEKRILISKE